MSRRAFSLKIMKTLISVLVLGIILKLYGGMASALSYQEDIGVNFTFNSALNITLSSSDIHIDNLAPGSAADSNIVNVNVLTNSPYGYTLNATVGNSTTYDTDDLVHSNSGISNVFSNTTFSSTPTITSNTNLAADTWAFSFSTDNGTNWANYNGLPMYDDTDHVAVLKESNGPVATNTGDDIKFKIGAKASSAQASGTYRNVINFNLVAAPTPVTIAMAFQSAGATQLNGYYKINDMTSAICSSVEMENDTLRVIDPRDNNVYMIGKLADGNCWMLDNLALDPTDATTASNMSTSNTNATAAAITNYLNGGGGTTGWSSVVVVNKTAVWSGSDAYIQPWINNQSKDTLVTSYGPASENGQAKVGVYYNYCAATVGTYCYASDQAADLPNTDIDAPYDICPSHWRMPTGGDYDSETHTGNGEYYELGIALGLTFDEEYRHFDGTTFQTALSTPLSGFFWGSSARDQNNSGLWWSSTYNHSDFVFVLTAYSPDEAIPTNYSNRRNGYSVRCLVSS